MYHALCGVIVSVHKNNAQVFVSRVDCKCLSCVFIFFRAVCCG